MKNNITRLKRTRKTRTKICWWNRTRFIFLSLYTWIVILFIILSVKSALIHWKRPWCWERLMARGEGDDRGWDSWMASPPQWTWVWVDSGSWWWTGRPGMLRFMGSQRVRHDWVTELNWDKEHTDKIESISTVILLSLDNYSDILLTLS